jgi:hypothetical protein
MAFTKVTDNLLSSGVGTGAGNILELDSSGKLPAVDGSNLTGMAIPTLDSPSITGTLSVDNGGNVSHTIANWSDDITYVITPTNCTVGAVNSSGVFVVTHTSGSPSYTIKATTDSLGLDDSALVTKNLLMNLSPPTLSSPADSPTLTNVIYTITSTDTGDDKIILDIGSSNFTFQSVSVGSASKVGNTVVCTGFTTNNPAVTVQFTAEATYSVTAKSINIAGTYGDSSSSSADSLTIVNTYDVDFLIVAGGSGTNSSGWYDFAGGAGGYRNSYNNEASGGGGTSESPAAMKQGTVYTVTVGAGGTSHLANAGNSSISGSDGISLISIGGSGDGMNGGSTSGSRNPAENSNVGLPTANQGYAGGLSGNWSYGAGCSGQGGVGGGGGGAGGVGQVSTTGSPHRSGSGGVGLNSSITGTSVARGGGGVGWADEYRGCYHGTSGVAQASHGGGVRATAGSVNTGGGSGGGSNRTDGQCGTQGATASQSGGSGVVILRMLTSEYSGTTTGSPTVATSGSDTILTFNGTGTYTG